MDNKRKKRIATVAAICVASALTATVLMGMVQVGGPGGGPGGGMGGGERSSGGSAESEQAAKKTVVETETPILGSIAVTGSFVGTVEPGQQVTVYPRASGKVVEANYKTGDEVEAGAVLFKLDSTALELDIAQSQANLRIAQAKAALSLENAQLNLETAEKNLENYNGNIDDGLNSSILQAEASVKSAEISLQQANVDYRNARQNHIDYLNDDWEGEYSDSVLESLRNARIQAELKVESAQLALENAKNNLKAVKNQVEEQKTSTENGVKTAETNVKTAELNTDFSAEQISLQKLQNNLADYTVTAPIGGVIEVKSIDAYDTVSTQTAAYIISNKELLSVSFGVAESALSYLHIGDTVTLEKNGDTCSGTVSEVATAVDSASGLYTVKATVESAPFELHSGSAVKLRAETQKEENVMLIPIDAVYYDNGSPYVFVFQDNAARRTPVEVGISDQERIHIKSGISMSDQIIVTWSASLYDGAEVYLPGTQPQESGGETDAAAEGAAPSMEAEASEGRARPDAGERKRAEADQEAAPGESGGEALPDPSEGGTP